MTDKIKLKKYTYPNSVCRGYSQKRDTLENTDAGFYNTKLRDHALY